MTTHQTTDATRYELAIDTASEDVSLLLARIDDGEVVATRAWRVTTNVTQELLEGIEALLSEAGVPRTALGRIAVDVGPGQYGALRAGIATAQGMALALALPVAAIGRLDADAAVAFARGAKGSVVAVHDARGSVAWAAFEDDGSGSPRELVPPSMMPVAEAVAAAPAGATWVGELSEALQAALAEAGAAVDTTQEDAEGATGDTGTASTGTASSGTVSTETVTRAHALLKIARARDAYGDTGLVDAVYLRPPPITPPRAG